MVQRISKSASPGDQTKPAKGERSRTAILTAAAQLATTYGLHGLSIGELAAHLGMSKSGLYAHFKSKEELELATIETIKRFVQLKIGLGFVPQMCVAEELERGSLAAVPVQDLTYERTLWVTHRREMTFSHAAAAFLELLHDQAKNKLKTSES